MNKNYQEGSLPLRQHIQISQETNYNHLSSFTTNNHYKTINVSKILSHDNKIEIPKGCKYVKTKFERLPNT